MKNMVVGRGPTVRVGPWRGQRGIASVATYVDQPVDSKAVAELLEHLRGHGYHRAITAALSPSEAESFEANGFECLRELLLLRRPLETGTLPGPQSGLKRLRRRKVDDVLAIDEAAFDSFWRFDSTSLREAIESTPHRLLRTTAHQRPLGYALSGVAKDRAYLQRLAVHPDSTGAGHGTALLLDALRWMQGRGADNAFVNTQHNNQRALELYERHGFSIEPQGLVIAVRDL